MSDAIQRIALLVQYDGTDFHGWQSQRNSPNLATVQTCLENAISKFADQPITTICAGRTDSGVHALGQVVHFDTTAKRDLYSWVAGCNSFLPATVVVRQAKLVSPDFHARFSALTRSYIYRIYNDPTPHALANRFSTWVRYPLALPDMQTAASYLQGEHDFSAFRASACQAKTAVRNLEHISISKVGGFIECHLRANAFLQHMVRNIMGSLLLVGRGKYPAQWMNDVLQSKLRSQAGPTAAANGLCLATVAYAPELMAMDEDVSAAENLLLI